MCNAWNHGHGCNCGWGGGSGSGGAHGSVTGYWGKWARPASIREYATQLGHSLTVPVTCRTCGQFIYLYASPDGGFVIFDDLGPPWPKHSCYASGSVSEDSVGYSWKSKRGFDFPVPDSAEYYRANNGTLITGIVVRVGREGIRLRSGIYWDAVILFGPLLLRAQATQRLRVGMCVRGTIVYVHDVGTVLDEMDEILPPSNRPSSAPEPR